MDYQFSDYTFDTERYELRRVGIVVKLGAEGIEVLAYLIEHRERLVSKQELLEQLWPQQFVGEATLHSHIRAARQAVGDTGQTQRVIQTIHGRGFRFVAEIDGHHPEWRESTKPSSPPSTRPLMPQGGPVLGESVWQTNDQEQVEPEPPTPALIDTEYKTVTVLCAGLAEATILAAKLDPEPMLPADAGMLCHGAAGSMLQYGGTLTHIAGDGFVALFGAPLADEDNARRAVLAAVALQQALQEHRESESPVVPLGIGVHTGPAVIGSARRGEPSTVYHRERDR